MLCNFYRWTELTLYSTSPTLQCVNSPTCSVGKFPTGCLNKAIYFQRHPFFCLSLAQHCANCLVYIMSIKDLALKHFFTGSHCFLNIPWAVGSPGLLNCHFYWHFRLKVIMTRCLDGGWMEVLEYYFTLPPKNLIIEVKRHLGSWNPRSWMHIPSFHQRKPELRLSREHVNSTQRCPNWDSNPIPLTVRQSR